MSQPANYFARNEFQCECSSREPDPQREQCPHGRLLEHDSIAALKSRHRRIVELAPSSETDRFCSVLDAAGHKFTRLSNGKLRVESATDSVAWLLELMHAQRLPPAEIVSNPDALHELFIKSLSDGGNGAAASVPAQPPPLPTRAPDKNGPRSF